MESDIKFKQGPARDTKYELNSNFVKYCAENALAFDSFKPAIQDYTLLDRNIEKYGKTVSEGIDLIVLELAVKNYADRKSRCLKAHLCSEVWPARVAIDTCLRRDKSVGEPMRSSTHFNKKGEWLDAKCSLGCGHSNEYHCEEYYNGITADFAAYRDRSKWQGHLLEWLDANEAFEEPVALALKVELREEEKVEQKKTRMISATNILCQLAGIAILGPYLAESHRLFIDDTQMSQLGISPFAGGMQALVEGYNTFDLVNGDVSAKDSGQLPISANIFAAMACAKVANVRGRHVAIKRYVQASSTRVCIDPRGFRQVFVGGVGSGHLLTADGNTDDLGVGSTYSVMKGFLEGGYLKHGLTKAQAWMMCITCEFNLYMDKFFRFKCFGDDSVNGVQGVAKEWFTTKMLVDGYKDLNMQLELETEDFLPPSADPHKRIHFLGNTFHVLSDVGKRLYAPCQPRGKMVGSLAYLKLDEDQMFEVVEGFKVLTAMDSVFFEWLVGYQARRWPNRRAMSLGDCKKRYSNTTVEHLDSRPTMRSMPNYFNNVLRFAVLWFFTGSAEAYQPINVNVLIENHVIVVKTVFDYMLVWWKHITLVVCWVVMLYSMYRIYLILDAKQQEVNQLRLESILQQEEISERGLTIASLARRNQAVHGRLQSAQIEVEESRQTRKYIRVLFNQERQAINLARKVSVNGFKVSKSLHDHAALMYQMALQHQMPHAYVGNHILDAACSVRLIHMVLPQKLYYTGAPKLILDYLGPCFDNLDPNLRTAQFALPLYQPLHLVFQTELQTIPLTNLLFPKNLRTVFPPLARQEETIDA